MKEKNSADLKSSISLKCDICKSKNISETREGFVCRNCGLMLNIKKFEYHKPYNNLAVQNSISQKTYIGYKNERYNSLQLSRLNKLHSIRSNKKVLLTQARYEISRILNSLKLSDTYKELIFEKLKKVYDALMSSSKYRSAEKLVPICIYFCLKINNISINESELLEVSNISKKDFNAFKLQICNFFPEFSKRNRMDFILQRIFGITEHFELGMPFYYQSKNILYKLYDKIKGTKDDVVAGVVASICALCLYKHKVSVNAISRQLGIRMSTIQWQIKKRILEPSGKTTNFISLVKSADLLCEVFCQMGLIETENIVDHMFPVQE